MSKHEILALSYSAYEAAKRRLFWADVVHLTVAILSFASATIPSASTILAGVGGALGLVGGLLVLYLRRSGAALRVVARKARLRSVLNYGFDREPSPQAVESIRARVGPRVASEAKIADVSGFWKLEAPVGLDRVREILRQSGFYAWFLFQRCETFFGWLLFTIGFLALLPLLILILTGGQDASLAVSVRFMAGLLYGAFIADLYGRREGWRTAKYEVRDLLDRLDSNPVTPELMLEAVSLYQLSVHTAAPIPTFFYRKYSGEIKTRLGAEAAPALAEVPTDE